MAVETPLFLNGSVVKKEDGLFRTVRQYKTIVLELPNTADATNTVTFNLATIGGATFLGVAGFAHTTDDSVCITENPTTSVSGTTITFTIPAGTDNDPRFYKVFYK